MSKNCFDFYDPVSISQIKNVVCLLPVNQLRYRIYKKKWFDKVTGCS